MDTEQTILEEAIELTSKTRQGDYGHPLDHHTRTAAMITALIQHKLKDGETFDYRDWQRAIICDKLARDTNRPKRDNETDIAGYARTMEMSRLEDEARQRTSARGLLGALQDKIKEDRAHTNYNTGKPCNCPSPASHVEAINIPLPEGYGLDEDYNLTYSEEQCNDATCSCQRGA